MAKRRRTKRYTDAGDSLEAVMLPLVLIAQGIEWVWRKLRRREKRMARDQ